MKLLFEALLLTSCLYNLSESKRCQSADECTDPNTCCVNILDPYRAGICVKLGKEGARCSPPESKLEFFQGKYVKYCPCQEGLECTPKNAKEGDNWSKLMVKNRCQKSLSTTAGTTTPNEATNDGEETTSAGGDENGGGDNSGNEDNQEIFK